MFEYKTECLMDLLCRLKHVGVAA